MLLPSTHPHHRWSCEDKSSKFPSKPSIPSRPREKSQICGLSQSMTRKEQTEITSQASFFLDTHWGNSDLDCSLSLRLFHIQNCIRISVMGIIYAFIYCCFISWYLLCVLLYGQYYIYFHMSSHPHRSDSVWSEKAG